VNESLRRAGKMKMESTLKYTIGIDLGTTNSVLAYCEQGNPGGGENKPPEIRLLKIPQLVAVSTIEYQPSLASFSYLANEAESKDGAFDLPWSEDRSYAIGELARVRGAEAPDRTVGASKSWLCHNKVDRRAPILPWNAPADVAKISPVAAAQQYLEHLVAAWHYEFPDSPLADQQVVLTVPASFDPVARELTREAAIAAGLPADFVLLEEPQAALYAWLATQGDDWRKILSVGQSVLVCDVGGGTTDLTLVAVDEEEGELVLRRAAVGDHLLVGGDNMDLAAAHVVAAKFAEKGTNLDPWQSVSLWHSCRDAKEKLLSDAGPDTHTISILGRGSKLIGGTVSVEVDKQEIADLLKDGFFPKCSLSDLPQRQPQSGFQEIGLPYESDPGITRHIAAFLSKHCAGDGAIDLPNHVLFNGGVFKADGFQDRMLNVMSDWSDDSAERVSPLKGGHDLDFAVARGGCFYGWNKQAGGLRIRGGSAYSYYVGIETAGLAIPGAPRPLKALCVVPYGMEEGTQASVPSGEIGLVVGQPVSFRFFRSSSRHSDQPGLMLERWTESELLETDPLTATLTMEGSDEVYVPVKFDSRITELGMFELWCVQFAAEGLADGQELQKWKLEFNVREEA
jgi:hypothetical protein